MAGAEGRGTSRAQGNGSLPTTMEIFEACSSWHRHADVYQVSNGIAGIKGGNTVSFSFLEVGVVGIAPGQARPRRRALGAVTPRCLPSAERGFGWATQKPFSSLFLELWKE